MGTTISEPLTATTTISRDVFGKPTAMTRSGSYLWAPLSLTRSYVYDANQRLCKTIEPESGATVISYDLAGNVAWRAAGQSAFFNSTTQCQQASVAANQKTSYVYDGRNRLTDTTYGDGSPSINTTYTADGLPWTVSSNNSLWTYTYNKRRLLQSEVLALGAHTYSIGHTYSANGHASALTYPNGSTINYFVNALGEQTRAGSYAYNVTRHPNGAIANFTYGNGIAHTGTQTERGLPDLSSDASTTVNVINDDYNWDENGNVTAIISGVSVGASRSMEYDARDRLTKVNYDKLGPAQVDFTYDPLDNLRLYQTPGRSYTNQYDASTWRLTEIRDSANVLKFSYAYAGDAGNRGNVTQRVKTGDSTTQNFTFTQGNRISALSGTNAETYTYDGMGRRTRLVTSSTIYRNQIYTQSGKLVYEHLISPRYATGQYEKSYVYLGNHLIGRSEGEVGSTAVKTYTHTDGLGTPVAETNAAGAVVVNSRNLYEPYGIPVQTGTTPTLPVQGPGYTGHVLDVKTGLSYMQQRYYDPVAGRFLSVDPVESNPGSFNRYWYANNNPYKFIDPDGRQSYGYGMNQPDQILDCRATGTCDPSGDRGDDVVRRDAKIIVGAQGVIVGIAGAAVVAPAVTAAIASAAAPVVKKNTIKYFVCGVLSLCGKDKADEVGEDIKRVKEIAQRIAERQRKAERKIEPPRPEPKKPIPAPEPAPSPAPVKDLLRL